MSEASHSIDDREEQKGSGQKDIQQKWGRIPRSTKSSV